MNACFCASFGGTLQFCVNPYKSISVKSSPEHAVQFEDKIGGFVIMATVRSRAANRLGQAARPRPVFCVPCPAGWLL